MNIFRFGLNPFDRGLFGTKALRNFINKCADNVSSNVHMNSFDEFSKYFYNKIYKMNINLERTPEVDTVYKNEDIANSIINIF